MSTEPTETVTSGGAPQEPNTEPEQQTGIAPRDEPEADQSETPAESEEDGPAKTIKRLQRRIERLSAKVGGTARERDLLAQEREQLRAELSTLKGEGGQAQESAGKSVEEIAEEKAREIVRSKALNERAADVLKAGNKLDGFEEALEALREEVPFADRQKRPTPFFEALLDADNPAKLIHYLGTNPEEAAEFDGLSPAQIGRRLAKLEAKLGAEVKTSQAPQPLKPVRPTAVSSGPSDEDSIDDWVKKERARVAAKRQA